MYVKDGKPSMFPPAAQDHLTMVLVNPGTVVTDPETPDMKIAIHDGNSIIVADTIYCTPVTFHMMRPTNPLMIN